MERTVEVENKGSLKTRAFALLESLQAKHTPGDTTFYIRRDKYADPRFYELDLELIRFLDAEGILKMSQNDYMRDGAVDPNIITLRLQPKGQELLASRTTVTRTETTVQETFAEPEEPAWRATKRTRDFVRTERGNMILTMCPEALESDIRGHLAALRTPGTPRKTQTLHKIWLSYELNWRWTDISEHLRHEMQDYRDLPITRRKKEQ